MNIDQMLDVIYLSIDKRKYLATGNFMALTGMTMEEVDLALLGGLREYKMF